ncbi:MAG TPA: hypothetical protein P5572_04055 [Phycisphaerae bacterium]|nr:hypothetical protein [Phycisphaerae bacterium]
MPNSKIKELESVVAKLESERQSHLEAIAEIEEAFENMGISPGEGLPRRKKPGPKPGKRRGRKPGPKPKAKRGRKPGPKPKTKRGGTKKTAKAAAKRTTKRKSRGKGPTGNRYAVSGTDLVLDMVKKAGSKGVPGADVDKVWKGQGRAGTAYNILGQLAKNKKIKKQKNPDGRGSLYVAA